MNILWKRFSILTGVLCLAVITSGCEFLPFTATIEVRNQSVASIVEVNISPSRSPSWGGNQLSENISQFDSATFTVPAGTYDLRAIDSLGRVATRRDVRLRPDDEEVWTITEFKEVEDGLE